jgi:hypothetical protein
MRQCLLVLALLFGVSDQIELLPRVMMQPPPGDEYGCDNPNDLDGELWWLCVLLNKW